MHKATPDDQEATLKVQKGFFRYALRTRNRLHPHGSIIIQLVEGPFKEFAAQWTIEPEGSQVKVSYNMKFEVINPMMAAMAAPFFDKIATDMVDVFHARAKHLYG